MSMLRISIIRLLRLFLLAVPLISILEAFGQYSPDVLGEGYEARYLDLDRRARATLIRRIPSHEAPRAVLYIHGYNDYFFQTTLADSIDSWSYRFYALDLRGYGRSLRSGDRLFECKDLRVYQEEISRAIAQMRKEGCQDIYLMAHSTGCLVSSLYLHDTNNEAGIRGLILNSPFIDYNSTKFNERVLLPLVTSMAWLLPEVVIIPPSCGGEVDVYAQSLLASHQGLWHFNQDWKRPQGYPIRASWLRAIKRGHRRVQAGLNIDIPILLLSSTRSILSEKQWRAEYAEADLVLDVQDMWRWGSHLGREVEFVKIPRGMHDLVLSKDPEARRLTYKAMNSWLQRSEVRAKVE